MSPAHSAEAVEPQPGDARACNEQAAALHAQGLHDQAIEWYTKAVELAPADAEMRTNLGAVHLHLGQLVQARAQFEKAAALRPDLLQAQVNLATTLHMLGEWRGARAAYLRACDVRPDFLYARVQAIALARVSLSWDDWHRQIELLSQATPDADNTAPQLDLLYLPLSAEALRTHAEAHSMDCARRLPPAAGELRRAPARDGRIRIGYVSDEFRRHAVGSLAVEVLELHDRERFDVRVYDFGLQDRSMTERRARAAVPFHDIRPLDAWQAAEQIAADGIDVLVDLKGHTLDSRLDIFAYRPAPVQMSWLGYPGTLGARYIDYLIADPFIIPAGAEHRYSEKVIRLPDSYQPNDRDRRISASKSRAAYGLPATAIVYGYLGKPSKLNPDVFDDWMAVLRAVPDSVLWMLVEDDTVRRNLIAEASRRGIAAHRLFFTGPMSVGDHIARFKVVDIALDAFPWGSHTTASEALWAGCPVVARVGDTFASRVPGSLLAAAGVPELIADNADDWRALAISLGVDRERRQAIRNRLAATRKTCALFDTPRFVRHLEAAFEQTVARARQGLPPAHLDIEKV